MHRTAPENVAHLDVKIGGLCWLYFHQMILLSIGENCPNKLTDAYRTMQPKQHNTDDQSEYVFLSDPLQLSTQKSLSFPAKAASRLAEQRSSRYDDALFALEDAELKMHKLASIMGMLPEDGNLPTAA